MRTTRGKPTLDQIVRGDKDTGEILAKALAAESRVDRWTHGFHTYPAGLHPDAARDLIAHVQPKSVFDPFCGGGTVLVEARAAGCRSWGTDVSPTAVRVSHMRTRTQLEEARLAFLGTL